MRRGHEGWTGLVAFVLAYFNARTWFDKETELFQGLGPGGTSSTAWDDYLVLLGGPFAALVLARGIVSAKVQSGTIQKTVANDGTAKLRQALTSDDDNIDLVDSQYLIFNLVAFGYVIVGLASTNRLPAIPGLLLALRRATIYLTHPRPRWQPCEDRVGFACQRASPMRGTDGRRSAHRTTLGPPATHVVGMVIRATPCLPHLPRRSDRRGRPRLG